MSFGSAPLEVEPVAFSSSRHGAQGAGSNAEGEGSAAATTFSAAHFGRQKTQKDPSPQRRLGGVPRIIGGCALAAVGVPMLVLPGPGLAAIAGGVALAASGVKRTFGKAS